MTRRISSLLAVVAAELFLLAQCRPRCRRAARWGAVVAARGMEWVEAQWR